MSGNAKRDPKSYHTPGVVNGNLAHDLNLHELERRLERSGQLDFDQQYRRRQETRADQLSRERQATRATVREPQKVPVAAVACSCVLAVLAVLVVAVQAQINAISSDIVSMKAEIRELEVEQIALQTQYEQAFDLASVKEAAEAVGMQQPGDGQIVYIDLPGEDQVMTCLEPEEGVLARIFAVVGQHICAMVEYFR